MTGSVPADVARMLVARQRVCLRLLAGVTVAAVMLIAGVVALIVAVATLSAAATIAVPCLVLVTVVITLAIIRHPERRAAFMDDADAREYLGRVEPIIVRAAGALHITPPVARIIDDEAPNALSIGSGRDGSIAYTSGLLDEIADEQQLEAVTAHLVARVACGDNALALFSFGLLGWALELFDAVVMRLVRWLRRLGNRCVGFALHRDTGYRGDEASFYARFALFVFALAFGIELLVAALALFLVGGVLAVVAAATLKGLARQRMRFADGLAAHLAGSPETMCAALSMLEGQPTELTRGGVLLQDLCVAGPHPQPGHVEYTPRIRARIACLTSDGASRSPGLLAPLSSAGALVAVVGLLGFLIALVPYGQRGAPAYGSTTLPAAAAGSASGQAAAQAQQSATTASPGISPVGATPTAPGQTTSSPGPRSSSTSSQGASSGGSPGAPGGPSSSEPPAAPGGVTATPDSQYTITVTWVNEASDAAGFDVDNGCPVGSCAPGATLARATGLTTTTTFTVTPGAYQCFRVRALDRAGASAWTGYGCASTPDLSVPGTQKWTDTGVTLNAGDTLGITAAGQVYIDPSYPQGPGGDQSCTPAVNYSAASATFPAPNLACWSLVGRIGNGPPFEVGSSTSVTTSSGRLYLGVNDGDFSDNSGSWNVRIKIGGLPPSP